MRRPIRPAAACLICCLASVSTVLAAGIHSTLTEAQKQYEQGHHAQALKLYQQADEAEPGHPAIEYNIGLCHLHLADEAKAVQHFESLASRGDVNRVLRRDAAYNVGLIRALSARAKLKELFAPATQPSDHKPAPDDPANIPKLEAIADELLRAIGGFRKSEEVEPGEDTEHNIRAARITRREVLGLLKRAAEAKQKDDILKDPRAYLEALILEQEQQTSLARLLILEPPKEAAMAREARRAGVRAQRKTMENTGTFADQLSQFRESAVDKKAGGPTSAPSSQPAQETPREQVYHAAAKQIGVAIEAQREACAFLLDNESKQAHEKQAAACDEMYKALYMFPLDPGQVLVKSRLEQAHLRQLVGTFKANKDWQRDPLLPEVEIAKDVAWNHEKSPVYRWQVRIADVLGLLGRQCDYVATTSRPADQAPADARQEPMLDPELNRKLADALKDVDQLQDRCLEGMADLNLKVTTSTQDELLKVIDAALELIPKTIEQRITELIVRQGRLNAEVQAEAGRPGNAPANNAAVAIDEVRKWATRFKSRLLGTKPARFAGEVNTKQKDIRSATASVNDEVKQKIPAGADAQAGGGVSPAASQPSELKAHIEASKHLVEAGNHMDATMKGLEQTIVEDSLKPMQPGGPVQTAQAGALEELVKALAALKPPTSQPNDDEGDKKQQQQKQEPQDQEQDKQREVDRLDRERERAERELYQRRPRTVIKDW